MDAPERIWFNPVYSLTYLDDDGSRGTEYVRADLYAALKAENDRLMELHEERALMHHDAEARADRLAAENERLLAYARETDCPRPCNGRPDDFTAVQCVEAGECGCGALAALSGGKYGE